MNNTGMNNIYEYVLYTYTCIVSQRWPMPCTVGSVRKRLASGTGPHSMSRRSCRYACECMLVYAYMCIIE